MPDMYRPSHLLAASLIATTLMISGCVLGGDDINGNGLRSYSGNTYTDHEIGYRLTFPSGWFVLAVPEAGGGLIDFSAATRNTKFNEPSASAWHSEVYEDETLQEWVESLSSFSYDSVVVLPTQVRNGVEVIPVEKWVFTSIATEKNRTLYFFRNGQKVTLTLSDLAAHFDTSRHIRFLDSSLTFF